MEKLLIADCRALIGAYKKYENSDDKNFANNTFDILRSFLKFLRNPNTKFVLCEKDLNENRNLLTYMMAAISDTKGNGSIIKNSRVHELIENKKSIKEQIVPNKAIIFKDKSIDSLNKYCNRYQKLGLNLDSFTEIWKRLSNVESEDLEKHFLISRKSDFQWNKVSQFKSPTEYIVIEDPYLGQMDRDNIKNNIIPIIKSLIPDRHNKSIDIQIIIVFGRSKAEKVGSNLNKMLENYEELLADEKKISISLYAINDKKLHDRHIYTENVIIQPSSSLDFMNQKGAVIKDLYKSYSIDVYGIGITEKFHLLEQKLMELKKEIIKQNKSRDFYGVAAFDEEKGLN